MKLDVFQAFMDLVLQTLTQPGSMVGWTEERSTTFWAGLCWASYRQPTYGSK